MSQSQAAEPNFSARTGSRKLCAAIATMLRTANRRVGRWTSAAKTIMQRPSIQITERMMSVLVNLKSKNRMKRSTVSSRKMSHKPRVSRNRDSCAFVLFLPSHKHAPIPAVKANVGAQKCVIQRVKKMAVVVRVRSVGEKDMAAELIKSR